MRLAQPEHVGRPLGERVPGNRSVAKQLAISIKRGRRTSRIPDKGPVVHSAQDQRGDAARGRHDATEGLKSHERITGVLTHCKLGQQLSAGVESISEFENPRVITRLIQRSPDFNRKIRQSGQ